MKPISTEDFNNLIGVESTEIAFEWEAIDALMVNVNALASATNGVWLIKMGVFHSNNKTVAWGLCCPTPTIEISFKFSNP